MNHAQIPKQQAMAPMCSLPCSRRQHVIRKNGEETQQAESLISAMPPTGYGKQSTFHAAQLIMNPSQSCYRHSCFSAGQKIKNLSNPSLPIQLQRQTTIQPSRAGHRKTVDTYMPQTVTVMRICCTCALQRPLHKVWREIECCQVLPSYDQSHMLLKTALRKGTERKAVAPWHHKIRNSQSSSGTLIIICTSCSEEPMWVRIERYFQSETLRSIKREIRDYARTITESMKSHRRFF